MRTSFFRDYVMVGLIFNILFSLVYNYINIKDCIANLQIKLQKREFDCIEPMKNNFLKRSIYEYLSIGIFKCLILKHQYVISEYIVSFIIL